MAARLTACTVMWLPTPHFQTSYNWVVRCPQGKIPSPSPEVKLVEWQSRLMPFWISSPASLIVRSPKLQSDCIPSAGQAGDRLCFGAWSREDPDFVLALLPGWSELAAAPLGVLILSRTQLFPGKLVCCHQDTGGQLGKKRRPFQMLSEREKKAIFVVPPFQKVIVIWDRHLKDWNGMLPPCTSHGEQK